jgi:hypothetical protein
MGFAGAAGTHCLQQRLQRKIFSFIHIEQSDIKREYSSLVE